MAVIISAAACGGKSEPAPVTTSPSTPATFGGAVGAASKQACVLDVRSVQQAVDLFRAREDRIAASIDELVTSGALNTPPATGHGYAIAYDPAKGVTATGACTYP